MNSRHMNLDLGNGRKLNNGDYQTKDSIDKSKEMFTKYANVFYGVKRISSASLNIFAIDHQTYEIYKLHNAGYILPIQEIEWKSPIVLARCIDGKLKPCRFLNTKRGDYKRCFSHYL
jgi:hypothetical protein